MSKRMKGIVKAAIKGLKRRSRAEMQAAERPLALPPALDAKEAQREIERTVEFWTARL